MSDPLSHWNQVYRESRPEATSWYEDSPLLSLDLLERSGLTADTSVIDVGAGRSPLGSALIARGLHDVSALDISSEALAQLDDAGDTLQRIVADVTTWEPPRQFDRWHDRAVLHFLTPRDAQAYRNVLLTALVPDGRVVIGVFSTSGPEACSGLRVTRYDERSLEEFMGVEFEFLETLRHTHLTPWGAPQDFLWILAQRRA